ncbi:MAG: YggT family protein [Candidatus Tokpelaia sp. JSC161]|jgi:YggT family protein|nr:MAG: YggT family protein [Candidatus Tokpelaia sp. JSC161]
MYALFLTIDLALRIYIYVLIASSIFSWLHAFHIINHYNDIVRMIGTFFYQVTEPVLRPLRKIFPNLMVIDISPILAFLLIYFIRIFMWQTIFPFFL